MEPMDPMNILTYTSSSADLQLIEGMNAPLYLGSIGVTRKKELLKNMVFTHVIKIEKIVTVCGYLSPPFPEDFEYKLVYANDEDTFELKTSFDDCADYIHEAMVNGQGVFVHCGAGISRSSTILIAYLIKYHKMRRDQALKFVRSFRPCASPNSGFLKQLREYEYEVLGIPTQENAEE